MPDARPSIAALVVWRATSSVPGRPERARGRPSVLSVTSPSSVMSPSTRMLPWFWARVLTFLRSKYGPRDAVLSPIAR
jgi:hypothetical protein